MKQILVIKYPFFLLVAKSDHETFRIHVYLRPVVSWHSVKSQTKTMERTKVLHSMVFSKVRKYDLGAWIIWNISLRMCVPAMMKTPNCPVRWLPLFSILVRFRMSRQLCSVPYPSSL